jgi:hypothetical protein
MNWDLRYWAPLEEALEIIEKRIAPESLPYFRRAAEIVSHLDKFRNKTLPSVQDFNDEKVISRKDLNRVVASAAIDSQRRCKVPLDEAARRLVGPNPAAAASLINFRDILRRTKRGLKREAYDQVKQHLAGLSPEREMEVALELYRIQTGKKRKP